MDNIDFKKLRQDKGWTQVKAATECKVAVVTWRLWESGGGKPNDNNYKMIAEVFDILPFAED